MLRSSLCLLLFSSLFSSSLAQLVATPANILCYQEVIATQSSNYSALDSSLRNWSQKLYQTLGLTGPIELSVGWARVPDRTGFENNCTGPYPNIADLFVHIQTNGSSNYDSLSSQLESFISSNRWTSQPNIACSARSIVTYLPGCGKTGGAGLNNGTLAPPTNTTGNATTSAPTNSTGSSNSTSTPTNSTGTSNSTVLPTTVPTNTTRGNSTTGIPTTVPTNSTTSNSTTAPSNGTETGTSTGISLPTIRTNGTTNDNSTSSNSTTVLGGSSADLSGTGGVSYNGAINVNVGVGLGMTLIVSMISMML